MKDSFPRVLCGLGGSGVTEEALHKRTILDLLSTGRAWCLFGRFGAVGSELWEEPASEEQQIQTGLPSSKCKNAKEKKGHSSSVKESYEVLLLTWKNSNYIL